MNLKAMAVVAGAVVASTASGDAVQWRVEDGGNGHWYQCVRVLSGIDWDSARAACQSAGGHLATIQSSGENSFVFALIGPASTWPMRFGPWLGGLATPSGWAWVTGEPWTWTNWMPGEPNNVCPYGEDRVHFIQWIDQWNDLFHTGYCGSEGPVWSYIIEWSADCNNDGIVDYGQCRDGTLPDYNSNNVPDCCEQGAACVVGNYAVEWRTADGGNGHWYQLQTVPLIWTAARAEAHSAGADLVALETVAELEWVRSHLPASYFLAGGIQDPNAESVASGWRWVTGGEIIGFAVNFDDNPCGVRSSAGEDGQQNYVEIVGEVLGDINAGPQPNCDDIGARQYILEWSADCNNDGVVDYGQILRGELEDTNANGVPDICDPCVADIVQDGLVNGIDLAAVLNNWGTKGGVIDADVNNDGIVDGSDLSIVLNGWGACP